MKLGEPVAGLKLLHLELRGFATASWGPALELCRAYIYIYNPLLVDRIWGIWASNYSIPESIF